MFEISQVDLKSYYRNNLPAYLDPIRKKILKATPEEEVRLKFLQYLTDKLEVPIGMIETEYPLSHYESKRIGRVDIVGFRNATNDTDLPLFIVECKAPHVPLTDDVFEQAKQYDECLQTGILILTNGTDTIIYVKKRNDEEYGVITKHLSYQEMLRLNELDLEFFEDNLLEWKRPAFDELEEIEIIEEFKELVWLGEGSNPKNYKYLCNLIGLIQDYNEAPILPLNTSFFSIIESGYRYTKFGNSAGGSWAGDYRYFIIKDQNNQNQVISISIMGMVYGNEDSRFPNSNGHTILIVAIDDYENSHNSLQLDLDRFVSYDSNSIEIWHDGALTVGNLGSAKKSLVIDFVRSHHPSLIRDNKIFLGRLPSDQLITWKNSEDFIINLISYALLRDQFRSYYKQIKLNQNM